MGPLIFRSLIRSGLAIVKVESMSGHILAAYGDVERYYGVSNEALCGLSTMSMLHPEDQPRLHAAVSAMMCTWSNYDSLGGYQCESMRFRRISTSGKVHWVFWIASMLDDSHLVTVELFVHEGDKTVKDAGVTMVACDHEGTIRGLKGDEMFELDCQLVRHVTETREQTTCDSASHVRIDAHLPEDLVTFDMSDKGAVQREEYVFRMRTGTSFFLYLHPDDVGQVRQHAKEVMKVSSTSDNDDRSKEHLSEGEHCIWNSGSSLSSSSTGGMVAAAESLSLHGGLSRSSLQTESITEETVMARPIIYRREGTSSGTYSWMTAVMAPRAGGGFIVVEYHSQERVDSMVALARQDRFSPACNARSLEE